MLSIYLFFYGNTRIIHLAALAVFLSWSTIFTLYGKLPIHA